MSNLSLTNVVRNQVNRLTSIATAAILPLSSLGVASLLTSCDDSVRSVNTELVEKSVPYTTINPSKLANGLPVSDLLTSLKLLEETKGLVSSTIKAVTPVSALTPEAPTPNADFKGTASKLSVQLGKLAEVVENSDLKTKLTDLQKVVATGDASLLTGSSLTQLKMLEKVLETDIAALKPGQAVSTFTTLSPQIKASEQTMKDIKALLFETPGTLESKLKSPELAKEIQELQLATTEILKLSSNPGADQVKSELALIISYNLSLKSLCTEAASNPVGMTSTSGSQQSLAEKMIEGSLAAVKTYEAKVAELTKAEDPYGHLVQKEPQQGAPGTNQAQTVHHTHSGGGFFYYPWMFNSGYGYSSGTTYHNYSGYHSSPDGLRSVPKSHFASGDYGKPSSTTGIKAGGQSSFKPSGSSGGYKPGGFGSTGRSFGGAGS